jgi:hypothetical protein
VLDRASSFADPEVVELLQSRYVPVALDVWYEERRQDAAGDFFRHVVTQREGLEPGKTTQGLYLFDPEGRLLQGWNNRDAVKLRNRLRAALDAYAPPSAPKRDRSKDDPRFARAPPEGGRVVIVRSRIVEAKWPATEDPFERMKQQSSGLDHLWIEKDEVEELARGRFPKSLATRIARFHAIDNTRGEPPMWEKQEVRELRIDAKPQRGGFAVEGELSLRTGSGDRGYDAKVRGVIERKGDALTRFDLVIRGAFFGEGTYTQGAPPGKFTLAIALTLAPVGSDAEPPPTVPPQGARSLSDYFNRS